MGGLYSAHTTRRKRNDYKSQGLIMKLVWKCDFCTAFSKDKEIMQEHEKKCSFNPASKQCWTCCHAVQEGAPISGYHTGCKLGLDACAVQDKEISCTSWKEEEK